MRGLPELVGTITEDLLHLNFSHDAADGAGGVDNDGADFLLGHGFSELEGFAPLHDFFDELRLNG